MPVNSQINSRRMAKNTLLLYFRMFITMLVSVYTSRVVLYTLGIEDFGIHNVVGGVVAMFVFLNGAMLSCTQRYITFALGKGDMENLKKVFSNSVVIHTLIAVLVVVLAETVGLWFLYNKLIIPETRFTAAFWVFQCSVFSTAAYILSVPYNASIVAHEKMSAFAYISVAEVFMKLLIVYLLTLFSFDKLIFYAVLLLSIQIAIRLIYSGYCRRHFEESRFRWNWDKKLFAEMLSFAGWNLMGGLSGVLYNHGLNILLNMFFGPAVNAARGVSVQVQNTVLQFSQNFQMAINPQITKSYAAGELDGMHRLIFRSSRITFFLLFVLALPIVFEADFILDLWLKDVPQWTTSFVRLMIAVIIVDSVANPLMISSAATGKIKFYQTAICSIMLTIVPVSYVMLRLGFCPTVVFKVHLAACCVAFVVRLFILRPMIKLSIRKYFMEVATRCVATAVPAFAVTFAVWKTLPRTAAGSVGVMLVAVFSTLVFCLLWGLDKQEKNFVNEKIGQALKKLKGR